MFTESGAKNGKIWEWVDSEVQYGKRNLWIMGSCFMRGIRSQQSISFPGTIDGQLPRGNLILYASFKNIKFPSGNRLSADAYPDRDTLFSFCCSPLNFLPLEKLNCLFESSVHHTGIERKIDEKREHTRNPSYGWEIFCRCPWLFLRVFSPDGHSDSFIPRRSTTASLVFDTLIKFGKIQWWTTIVHKRRGQLSVDLQTVLNAFTIENGKLVHTTETNSVLRALIGYLDMGQTSR